MNDERELPPLPQPFGSLVFDYEDADGTLSGTSEDCGDGYSADQMRAYARAARALPVVPNDEQKEARRYRWMRAKLAPQLMRDLFKRWVSLERAQWAKGWPNELDKAIDAALGEPEQPGSPSESLGESLGEGLGVDSAQATNEGIEIAQDAERYRWLRAHSFVPVTGDITFGAGYVQTKPEILDAALDAVRHG